MKELLESINSKLGWIILLLSIIAVGTWVITY